MILLIFLIIAIVGLLIMVISSIDSNTETSSSESKPERAPLTEAEREAIRQADEVFDWKTHNAIVSGAYEVQLPEYVAGGMWTNLYPDIYHTKIAGINFARGVKNLVGVYFDCTIVADPQNRYDKNAIKIVHTDGRCLGYIPSDETETVREFLSGDLSACICRAHIDEREEWDEERERDRTFLIGEINIKRVK